MLSWEIIKFSGQSTDTAISFFSAAYTILLMACASVWNKPVSYTHLDVYKRQELEQKDQLIVELKTQLNESLTLNEKLNKENRALNIQSDVYKRQL